MKLASSSSTKTKGESRNATTTDQSHSSTLATKSGPLYLPEDLH